MKKAVLYSLFIGLCASVPSAVHGRLAPEDAIYMTLAIESGKYDVFEFVIDSTVLLGAEQYTMHYGRVVQSYVGSASDSVEVLVTCDNRCEDNSAVGDTLFMIAQKHQYRYKVDSWYGSSSLMYIRAGEHEKHDKHKAVVKYCLCKKNRYSGKVDITYGDYPSGYSRTAGSMVDGQPTGVWLYQYEHTRRYIQYVSGVVCDTTYRFAFTKAGWQVVQKALTRGDTEESWSYGRLDRINLYGIHLLKSYTKTTGSAPTASTTVKYHSSGAIKRKRTRHSYGLTSDWRSNICYKHGPVVHQYANGRDSLQGQYAYGHKVGTWTYYDKYSGIDSVVIHAEPQKGDSINFIVHDDYDYDGHGTYLLKDGNIDGQVRIYYDGTLHTTIETCGGLVHGHVTYYREDSTIYEILNYNRGKLDGHAIKYKTDGSIRSKRLYTHGQLNGPSEIEYQSNHYRKKMYNCGHLTRVQEWKGDSLITDLVYERGLPTGVKGQKNGGYGTLVNGVHHGPAEVHDKNGRLSSYGNFYLGRKHGLWHERYLDEVQFREVRHW